MAEGSGIVQECETAGTDPRNAATDLPLLYDFQTFDFQTFDAAGSSCRRLFLFVRWPQEKRRDLAGPPLWSVMHSERGSLTRSVGMNRSGEACSSLRRSMFKWGSVPAAAEKSERAESS